MHEGILRGDHAPVWKEESGRGRQVTRETNGSTTLVGLTPFASVLWGSCRRRNTRSARTSDDFLSRRLRSRLRDRSHNRSRKGFALRVWVRQGDGAARSGEIVRDE